MKRILLGKTIHKDLNCITLRFEKEEEMIRMVRDKIPALKWSATLSSWYLREQDFSLPELFKQFKGLAFLDYTQLKNSNAQKILTKNKKKKEIPVLSAESQEKLARFKDYLLSKRYSESTISTYHDAVVTFLRFFKDRTIETLTNEDIIHFNNDYILANQLSQSYQNQVINGLKLFAKIIDENRLQPELMHRPRPEKKLPNVLSKEEVKRILQASTNQKHGMMLSLIYACGLRRSELLNLKKTDIQSDRMILYIRQSKGKKDRIVPLSPLILERLREYYKSFRPQQWLFEGQNVGQQYSEKSLQNVLKQAIAKASIKKPVTLHWLRHSYATHLLENGTDLRYIQELLGHSSSRTTEIYTHVSTKSIQNIVSPFDTL